MSSERRFPPTGAERGFATAFLVLAVTAWCAFTLAEFGLFSRGHLLAVGMPLFVAATWWVWRDTTGARAGAGRVPIGHGLVLVACLAATVAATARPAEYYVDGRDASVYLNIAAAIERRGGITVTEPLLADLDDDARQAFFERDPLWPHLLNFFPGGIQIAADGSHLQPSFFHLLPAAMAGSSALIGRSSGVLLILPLSAALTLAAVWLLAVRLSSPLAGSTAAVLLTLNFAHLWFARYPAPEALTGCFVLAGLAFTLRATQDGSRQAAALGGLAFGLAAATRLDALILVSPLVAGYLAVVALRRQWTSATTWLAATFGLFTLQALLHAGLVSTAYTQRILWQVFATDWWIGRTTLLIPAAAVVAAAMAWLAWRSRAIVGRTPLMRVLFALLLVAAIVRSWPQLWSGPAALLFSPLGLALMACGAVWFLLDDPSPEVLLVVALFVVSAVAYVEAPRAGRWYPLMWRRFIPVVLPVGLVLVGHMIGVLSRQRASWRWAGGIVVVVIAVTFGRHSHVLATSSLTTGVHDQLTQLAASLPDHAVLLTDATTPSQLGLSVYFTFGTPALWARQAPGTPDAIDRLATTLAESGRSLVLAVSPHAVPGGLTRQDFARWDLIPASPASLSWRELERSMTEVPSQVRSVSVRIERYDVVPARPRALPVSIDIGLDDFNWRGDGFYGPEPAGDATVRWTGGRAEIALPQIEPTTHARLVARLVAPRPEGASPVTVTFLLDDVVVGTTPLPPGFSETTFDLDAAVIDRLVHGPAQLTLRASTFVPRDSGMGEDARELGVMIDWLRLEAP